MDYSLNMGMDYIPSFLILVLVQMKAFMGEEGIIKGILGLTVYLCSKIKIKWR